MKSFWKVRIEFRSQESKSNFSSFAMQCFQWCWVGNYHICFNNALFEICISVYFFLSGSIFVVDDRSFFLHKALKLFFKLILAYIENSCLSIVTSSYLTVSDLNISTLQSPTFKFEELEKGQIWFSHKLL